jgi:hypothetical protein
MRYKSRVLYYEGKIVIVASQHDSRWLANIHIIKGPVMKALAWSDCAASGVICESSRLWVCF